ncbi:hypothetical protein SDC9_199354 [bioreactor metagenome]|uniref:Uncharacterized protein n=1 Tax=bioreactor metagenome TaxID=1076179 RepID=A0A645IK79_9ZZZZ
MQCNCGGRCGRRECGLVRLGYGDVHRGGGFEVIGVGGLGRRDRAGSHMGAGDCRARHGTVSRTGRDRIRNPAGACPPRSG